VTVSPVTGVHQGGGVGAYHYAVYTPIGAKLIAAQATNGTANSVLTVSHCELGGDAPEQPGSTISSEVHLDGSHTVINSSSPEQPLRTCTTRSP
jgi:hypothetical protein